MSQSRRERRQQERMARKSLGVSPVKAVADTTATRPKTIRRQSVVAIMGTILLLAGVVLVMHSNHHPFGTAENKPLPGSPIQPVGSPTPSPASVVDQPSALTLGKLTAMKPTELGNVDIATMNLLCAQGLTGSEQLDLTVGLRTLDDWAHHVDAEIKRNQHRFEENPAEYENKENLFKVVMLILTLQQDLGVHYDANSMGVAALPHATQAQVEADLADEHYFKDSKAAFLNGILGEKHLGTCSSLPVLYVAIGRRLGFPLKLVLAKGHAFIRWDEGEGKERFNMEGTGGVDSLPDEHYRSWPLPISDEEVASGEYLRSLTPSEELALFLETRAVCLRANGRIDEALVAMSQAYRLRPNSFNAQIGLDKTAEVVTARIRQEQGAQNARSNNPFAEIQRVEAINRANQQQMNGQNRSPQMPGNTENLSRQPTPAGPAFGH